MTKLRLKWPRPAWIDCQCECYDCDWQPEGKWFETAKQARKHAKETGHRLGVQWGYVQEYNPSESKGDCDDG